METIPYHEGTKVTKFTKKSIDFLRVLACPVRNIIF